MPPSRKQGVFNLVFHPHGWIKAGAGRRADRPRGQDARQEGQVPDLPRGPGADRRNLLGGQPLRAADGSDNGVRLLDLDGDGFMDVVVGNPEAARQTRLWDPKASVWKVGEFPATLVGATPSEVASGGSGSSGRTACRR